MAEVFLDHNTLAVRIEQDRDRGHTIVFANGHFDLLHVGHTLYVQGAGAVVDRLVVAVIGDASTRALKGDGRPIIPAAERAEIVAALKCVGYVTIFDDPTVEPLLRLLRPYVHDKGTDYRTDTVPEKDVMAELGGRVAIVGDPKDHATKNLIERVKALPG